MGLRVTALMLGCALAMLGASGPAFAEDEAVIDEVLAILKERGLVDEARYTSLVSKNHAYEEQHQSLLGRIEWSGDMRGRLENFWYDDNRGSDRPNRTRMRYRLRIKGKAKINDIVSATFRIASGIENRSSNQTLGSRNDFDPDNLFIDQAYLEFKMPSGYLPENASLKGTFGKVYNPFRWKNGRDYLLWDSDLNPEGIAIMFTMDPTEATSVFVNTGYFILDENSTNKDPHVFGLQAGGSLVPSEAFEIGGRVSWYSWRSLDDGFSTRMNVVGNNIDFAGDNFNVMEGTGYVKYFGVESWPMLFYGQYVKNLDSGDDEGDAWGVGFEVGDKKKYAKLGLGYYKVEANAWPARFTDSDLFDGFTNRKGWTMYGSREVFKNTDFNVTLFVSDDLKSDEGFQQSLGLAKRVRLQTDIAVKF